MSPARQALVDTLHEIEQQLAQANIIASEMCTTLSFRSQIQLGHGGLERYESSIDELLTKNDSRVVISCVAGTTSVTNIEQIGKVYLFSLPTSDL